MSGLRKMRSWCSAGAAGAWIGAATVVLVAAPRSTPTQPVGRRSGATTASSTSPVKAMLAEEAAPLEREIASRMMRRADVPADRRARLELEIDLRIIQRALIETAAKAKFESPEQADAWLRAKETRQAVHAMEETLDGATAAPSDSQREAIAQLHKLSYTAADAKSPRDMDAFCRGLAITMVNAVNATPISASALVNMRPSPSARTGEHQASVGELTERVQKLAAISVPLRQQMLALAAAATTAGESDEGKTLYGMLSQAIALAQGLQSNTAVNPEARTTIETQLAEGLVLFSDPRTRDAGRNRVDALGQYRQTLVRVGKMGLTTEQMNQLAPALAWAQANPEAGAKLMNAIEQFLQVCAKWDALPRDTSVPTTLRRPLEDLRSQFAKVRASFMQGAAKLGTIGGSPAEFDQALEDIKRLYAVAEDLTAMGMNFDTLNAFKIKPAGGLERKVTTAAIAAVATVPSTNRNDGQKYLGAVHDLANFAQRLGTRPLTEIPPAVLQGWAGAHADAFATRWKAIVTDLGGTLAAGALELDKGKLIRLETAITMQQALRNAAQFEAAFPKTASLARWVDWSIDPASLQLVLSPYKESMSAAFLGYASDNLDAVDDWTRLHTRIQPLIALVLRDVAYAQQCEALPIGLVADVSRLGTPFDAAPFATERFASYAIGVWTALERSGDPDGADRMSLTLAKQLAHDLHLPPPIDQNPPPTNDKRTRN